MSENDAKWMSVDAEDVEGHQVQMEPQPDGVRTKAPEPDGAYRMLDEDEDVQGHVRQAAPESDGAYRMLDGDEDVEGHQVRMEPQPDGVKQMLEGQDDPQDPSRRI